MPLLMGRPSGRCSTGVEVTGLTHPDSAPAAVVARVPVANLTVLWGMAAGGRAGQGSRVTQEDRRVPLQSWVGREVVPAGGQGTSSCRPCSPPDRIGSGQQRLRKALKPQGIQELADGMVANPGARPQVCREQDQQCQELALVREPTDLSCCPGCWEAKPSFPNTPACLARGVWPPSQARQPLSTLLSFPWVPVTVPRACLTHNLTPGLLPLLAPPHACPRGHPGHPVLWTLTPPLLLHSAPLLSHTEGLPALDLWPPSGAALLGTGSAPA